MRAVGGSQRRPYYLLFSALLVIAAMAWRWNQQYPLPLFDLYPLYYGGQAWVETGSAYDLAPVVPTSHQTSKVYLIGNGYPLPAVLLMLPLTLLPEHVAATLWVGLLVAGVLLTLRLLRAPLWMLLYLPLVDGIRLEQYTIFIVILQLAALWALRERRYGLLAIVCALILTKPTQGLLFVVLMVALARNWRQQALAFAAIWGGSLALDPGWLGEWLAALGTYREVAQQPTLWWLALLALPALRSRDWLSAALIGQLAITPYADLYSAAALPLGALHDPRSRWLSVISFLYVFVAFFAGKPLAVTLTLALPLAVLAGWRGRPRMAAADTDTRRSE